jgi:hypothetical protein
MKRILFGTAFGIVIFGAASMLAHHSGVMFEESKEVTLQGVVKEFQYTNPHSWLLVDVTGPDGKVTTWGFEAEGPTTMMSRGIRRNDFPPGSKVTVTGRPMKDGRPAAAWSKAVRADGKVFVARGPQE